MKNAECRIAASLVLAGLVFWGWTGLGADAQEARVSVEAGQVVRTVDARLFGINAVMWDGLLDTPDIARASFTARRRHSPANFRRIRPL